MWTRLYGSITSQRSVHASLTTFISQCLQNTIQNHRNVNVQYMYTPHSWSMTVSSACTHLHGYVYSMFTHIHVHTFHLISSPIWWIKIDAELYSSNQSSWGLALYPMMSAYLCGIGGMRKCQNSSWSSRPPSLAEIAEHYRGGPKSPVMWHKNARWLAHSGKSLMMSHANLSLECNSVRHPLGNTIALASLFTELWQISVTMEAWMDKYTRFMCESNSR